AIGVRGELSCALTRRREVTCWGWGREKPTTVVLPADRATPSTPASVAIGPRTPAISIAEGSAVCVTTADGRFATHPLAATRPGAAVRAPAGTIAASCTAFGACSLARGGTISCDRRGAEAAFAHEPDGARLSSAGTEGCVLRRDGILRCGVLG